jgi:hypothetical protein
MGAKKYYLYLRNLILKKKAKRVVVVNAFSLSMLKLSALVSVHEISKEELEKTIEFIRGQVAKGKLQIYSVVGHESTAKLLTNLLGVEIKVNRERYVMDESDILFVMQLLVRLEPGRELNLSDLQQLLDEGKVKFFLVSVKYL